MLTPLTRPEEVFPPHLKGYPADEVTWVQSICEKAGLMGPKSVGLVLATWPATYRHFTRHFHNTFTHDFLITLMCFIHLFFIRNIIYALVTNQYLSSILLPVIMSSDSDDHSTANSIKCRHYRQRRQACIAPRHRSWFQGLLNHFTGLLTYTLSLSLQLSVAGRDIVCQLHSPISTLKSDGFIILGIALCIIFTSWPYYCGPCCVISASSCVHRGFTGSAPFLYPLSFLLHCLPSGSWSSSQL